MTKMVKTMGPEDRSDREETPSTSAPIAGRLPMWLPAVTLAIGALGYCGSLNGPFIFDDITSITENEHIRQLWPLSQSLSAPSQSTAAGRPVVCFSLAVNYAIGGLNVLGYHLLNVALHMASTLLLLGIIRRTLLSPKLGGRFEQAAPWLATTSATLWMLHPLQTEAVTYVIQRTELFMAFFCLLTFYCVIRGWASSRRRLWFTAGVVACVLGMASKEVMGAVPVLILVYDRVFVSPDWKTVWRRDRLLHGGLAATWFILAWLIADAPRGETVGIDLGIRPLDYLATQAGVILYYLRLCFWPHPLVITYDDWPVASISQAIPQGLVILLLLMGAFWALRRASWIGFLGAWFFLILAPTSSFVPIISEMAAERRMYLPLAAVVVLAVMSAHTFSNIVFGRLAVPATWRRGLNVGLVATASGVLCYATIVRNHDYRSSEAIWADAVAKRPNSVYARNDLGLVLGEQGRLDEAISEYREALRIAPGYALAHYNLGFALTLQNKLDEAITHYSEALRLKPAFVKARTNLGIVLALQGKLDEAVAQFLEALRIQPVYGEARYNLAGVLVRQERFDEAIAHYAEYVRIEPTNTKARGHLGRALAHQGRLDEAITQFSDALRISPVDPDLLSSLASALGERGRYAEAIQSYQEVLRINPDSAEAHNGLGIALARTDRPREALEQFQEAVRLKPDWAPALNAAAWMMATQPDAAIRREAEAIRLAERSAELSGFQDAGVLDTLAAAYASAEQYERAVTIAEKAISVASAGGDEGLAAEISSRLGLYREGKPYREPASPSSPPPE